MLIQPIYLKPFLTIYIYIEPFLNPIKWITYHDLNELNINNHDFFMFLCSWHKLVLYYATYIIINIKTLIESKKINQ